LILFQNGADPNIRTKNNLWDEKIWNKTAFEIAKINGSPNIASIIGTTLTRFYFYEKFFSSFLSNFKTL
jgi:hypothetical protein